MLDYPAGWTCERTVLKFEYYLLSTLPLGEALAGRRAPGGIRRVPPAPRALSPDGRRTSSWLTESSPLRAASGAARTIAH